MTGARLSSAVGEVPVVEAVENLAVADGGCGRWYWCAVIARRTARATTRSARGADDPSRRCAAPCGALSRSGLPSDDHATPTPSQRRTALRAARMPPRCAGRRTEAHLRRWCSLSRPRAPLSGGREFYPHVGTTTTYLHWGARQGPAPARSHGLWRSSPVPAGALHPPVCCSLCCTGCCSLW